jgi:phosphotransacetylase/acyl dehydratase
VENFDNVIFDEIEPGRSVSVSRTVAASDLELLCFASGNVDSLQIDGGDAATEEPHASGAGTAVFFSYLLRRRLPGPGTRVVAENFRFDGRIVAGDTLTATVTALEKHEAEHRVVFECRCVNQRGETLLEGTATVEAPTRRMSASALSTPEIVLRRNDVFAHVIGACAGIPPITCAVVHPCDRDSLLGPIEAAKRGLILPVLVGPEAKIRAVAQTEGVDLSPYRIVPTEHSHEAALQAVQLARAGEADALMKGSLHTDELMAAVVPSATGLRTARRMSHVFVMDVPAYPRMLLVTDAAINIFPMLEEKRDIVQNAIDLAHVLGIAQPKVAIVSAVETVNPKIPSSTEAASLCKMADRGQITGGILDGPLAFDNAINLQAARTKNIDSPVAGRADILVMPDLEAGNMVAKQLQYLAGADSAGIVLGTRVPIVLTSRADTVRTRLASTAVMALLAHYRHTGEIVMKAPHA